MAPALSISRTGDQRFQLRVKCGFEGHLSGPFGKIRLRGLDLHDSGAGMMVRQPIAPGSIVFIHFATFQSMGFATVRHCRKAGLWNYVLGVEFRSPLMREEVGRWRVGHIRPAEGSPDRWLDLVGAL